jgi:hypothetical protein
VSATEYHYLVHALAGATGRRDAELAVAERSYQDGAARVAAELARVTALAVEADQRAGTAASTVLDVDRDAAALWDEMRRSRRWRIRGIGPLPAPLPGAETDPAVAVELLDEVARRIDTVRRGAPRPPLPRMVLPLLPPLGAMVATMTGLVADGMVTMSGLDPRLGWPLRLLGWMTFLLAPFAGVPVAAFWVDRQFGSRLDIGATGLIVLGGMAAGCGLSLLVSR